MALERGCDLAREAAVDQVGDGQVDGHAELAAAVEPAPAVGQRGVEHVQRQRAHQRGLLGDGEELARGEQPALRVLPAHERLDARHAAVGAGAALGW